MWKKIDLYSNVVPKNIRTPIIPVIPKKFKPAIAQPPFKSDPAKPSTEQNLDNQSIYFDRDSDIKAESDSDPDTDSDPDSDSDPDTDPDTDSDTDTDPDTDPDT